MKCIVCKKQILEKSPRRLENHARKGTWHRIGELTEEEKIQYDYPFHEPCAQVALAKKQRKYP